VSAQLCHSFITDTEEEHFCTSGHPGTSSATQLEIMFSGLLKEEPIHELSDCGVEQRRRK